MTVIWRITNLWRNFKKWLVINLTMTIGWIITNLWNNLKWPVIYPSKSYDPLVEDYLNLMIIAKTRMNHGFCYIGWDTDMNELLRPILRTGTNQCCWLPTDPSFEVGQVHIFQVGIRSPREIPNPHNVNDVQVKHCGQAPAAGGVANLFNILAPLSHDRIEDIFGGANIVQKRYVLEGTCCPSVGIYRCKRKFLRWYTVYDSNSDKEKSRCVIKQGGQVKFDFPLTSLQFYNNADKQGNKDEDVLVILGLGRPYAGSVENRFFPRRCYILVVGIIEKSLDELFSELHVCHNY